MLFWATKGPDYVAVLAAAKQPRATHESLQSTVERVNRAALGVLQFNLAMVMTDSNIQGKHTAILSAGSMRTANVKLIHDTRCLSGMTEGT